MRELGFNSSEFERFHDWSVSNKNEFWKFVVKRLGIVFAKSATAILDGADFFPGAELNISESCFQTDSNAAAIQFRDVDESDQTWTYGELDEKSQQVAGALIYLGFAAGDRIAIDMPMTPESVAIYLGIVRAGMTVVSIADSFAPEEIRSRLRIAEAKLIFTQDVLRRAGKTFPLYEKVTEASLIRAIVLPANQQLQIELRDGDLEWSDFLSHPCQPFSFHYSEPNGETNILFSSGTTGDPKAIPWTHLTPIKSAMDGHFHHDIRPGDVVAWPTNLGWMMGPWLIYAALINRATIAIFGGVPTDRAFGEFVSDNRVTMLGLVPSLVKSWRASQTMEGLDWSKIRVFSSTGECSNAEDYAYLMSLANNRPVIEYCGGTEIGGGFITGSILQPARPATFTTPALGNQFLILDENRNLAQSGEVFLDPVSIGLSQTLLNRDHHEIYFADCPRDEHGQLLRRHGDEFERIGKFYRALGRADDTMNLGGIKVGSAEIERVVSREEGVIESAAIAVSPAGGGPSELALFVVLSDGDNDLDLLRERMQSRIRAELNPLFKIAKLHPIDLLPRTASNKVMRRRLRDSLKP